MRDDEIPEWESRLQESGGIGPRRQYPRRIDEVRAAARASREARSRTTEALAKAVAIVAATIIILSTLAITAAIIGGAYWLLTGEPIF